MIRRAAIAALFVVMLSSSSVMAAGKTVDVSFPNFAPAAPKIARGNTITWRNLDSTSHTATSNVAGLWSSVSIGSRATTAPLTFNQSGTFLYHCAIHPSMRGKVAVKLTASPATGTRATTFTLTLGRTAVPSGFTHEVQVSRNGGGYTSLPSTTSMTTTYKPTAIGTYKFRTRLRGGGTTGWSPAATIRVN